MGIFRIFVGKEDSGAWKLAEQMEKQGVRTTTDVDEALEVIERRKPRPERVEISGSFAGACVPELGKEVLRRRLAEEVEFDLANIRGGYDDGETGENSQEMLQMREDRIRKEMKGRADKPGVRFKR